MTKTNNILHFSRRHTNKLAVISCRGTDEFDGLLKETAETLGMTKSALLLSIAQSYLIAGKDRQSIRLTAAERARRTKVLVAELYEIWCGEDAAGSNANERRLSTRVRAESRASEALPTLRKAV